MFSQGLENEIFRLAEKFNFYFQVLLEFDKLSWKEREWYSVYEENAVLNSSSEVNILYIKETDAIIRKKNLQEKKKDKNVEKGTKRKRRKTDLDSEEEVEEFQIFCIEDKLRIKVMERIAFRVRNRVGMDLE